MTSTGRLEIPEVLQVEKGGGFFAMERLSFGLSLKYLSLRPIVNSI